MASLDTSVLAELYGQETGRGARRIPGPGDRHGGGSVIDCPGARAVFDRRRSSGGPFDTEHREMVAQFQEDWNDVNGIDVTPGVR